LSTIKCNHCHIEFEKEIMIKEGDLNFCCNGCQGVYHILKDEGLDSFYDKMGNNKISPPLNIEDDIRKFDREGFEKKYIKIEESGNKKVDLIIEGIHCAACVWLNEKVLYDTNGIIEASINFTNNKAIIVWDPNKISLSQIIMKIRSIGYNAYPYDKNIKEQKATKSKKDFFIKMMVAVAISLNIMMIGIAKYTGFFSGIDKEILNAIHIAEFFLATPVLFYSGSIFFKGAYFGLKNKIINMDLLVATGASLAYLYSIYVMFGGYGHSYFDSVAMIITFILVGKYLEVIGKKNAVDTLDTIKSQLPIDAIVIRDGQKCEILVDEILLGDIVELRAGDKASVDGEVISGDATFDENSISGESIPVTKTQGSKIFGGTVNLDSVIRYKTTKDFEHSTLNNIVTFIEDSLSSKPTIENSANELSKSFSIAILLISLFTFLGWYFYLKDFENALINSISVIIIACPCALALATPMASLIGISQLAKKKLLFKESKYLETMSKATTVVFDKTGTLTNGKLKVVNEPIKLNNKDELNLIYNLCDSTTHPISNAVKNYIEEKTTISQIELTNFETIAGKGIKANYKNQNIIAGNILLMKENNIKIDIQSNMSIFSVAINNKIVAVYELEDTIKDDALETINYIKNQDLKIIMLTGDNENVAQKITNEIGIENFEANLTPIDKANYLKKLKANNEIIVMVGDGINDAPALAIADISVVMGNGADVSIGLSDIVILDNKLQGLVDSFVISKRTYKFIKQNLTISLIYNIITIPLAVFGYVIPLVAALSMSLSSLLVVGNSLRIRDK
jgi:P-type Cu+ transporter